MRESDSSKPAIFAMSNPTMNGLFVYKDAKIFKLASYLQLQLVILFFFYQLNALLLMLSSTLEKTLCSLVEALLRTLHLVSFMF